MKIQQVSKDYTNEGILFLTSKTT